MRPVRAAQISTAGKTQTAYCCKRRTSGGAPPCQKTGVPEGGPHCGRDQGQGGRGLQERRHCGRQDGLQRDSGTMGKLMEEEKEKSPFTAKKRSTPTAWAASQATSSGAADPTLSMYIYQNQYPQAPVALLLLSQLQAHAPGARPSWASWGNNWQQSQQSQTAPLPENRSQCSPCTN